MRCQRSVICEEHLSVQHLAYLGLGAESCEFEEVSVSSGVEVDAIFGLAELVGYWLNLCQGIKLSADCGNSRPIYDGMKKALGPSTTKIVSLKCPSGEIVTDKG